MDQGTNADKHSSNEFLISVYRTVEKWSYRFPSLISITLNQLLTSNTVFTIYMATVRQRKPLSSSRSNKAVVTVDPVCHPFHLIPTLGCTNNVFFRFKQRFPFFSPHNDQHVKCRKETRDISLLCSLVSHNIQQKKRSEFKHTNG